MLNFSAIIPQPPIIIPQIGAGQSKIAKRTVDGVKSLAEDLKKFKPDTIVIISPHGPMRYDKFTVNLEENLKGNFENFGIHENLQLDFRNDTQISKNIFSLVRKRHLPIELIRENKLDYGSLVPLFYLTSNLEKKPKIVPLTHTALDWETHFGFGKVLNQVFENTDQNIALIACGDLSHRLTEDAPAGYSPYGLKFDQTLIKLLEQNEVEKILNLNPDFCEEAGQFGLPSIIMALGALSGLKYNFKQLSYESPFGVGYLVGRWKIG